MVLGKVINSNIEIYYVEINTNDDWINVVTLYDNQKDRQPLIQEQYSKNIDDDYIKMTKDIVIKYETGDKTVFKEFFAWNGFILD